MTLAFSVFLGALSWTLLEYLIHRFLGHWHTKNPFGAEHTAHHSRGNYFAPWYKKLGATALFSAFLFPISYLFAGSAGVAYTLGLIAFYGYYEALHFSEHKRAGLGAYGRWARRHHFYHHFHNPRVNHGVTTPLWDLVFGTYVAVQEPIRVPQKLQMAWLCDPTTHDVWTRLQPTYELRTRKKR